MKTIGLLGGMSWESTVPYYRVINQEINRHLGGLHSARIVLYSVEFDQIEHLQHTDRWDEAARILIDASRAIERAGAEMLVICTNTMHRVYDEIAGAISVPMLHIADATAATIRAAGCARVGLLGTRFTMEGEFYRGRLREHHGLEVVVPGDGDRELVHRVIYDELCHGKIRDVSRHKFRRVIRDLARCGAEGIVLGCTEISMLVGPDDSPVPTFDTTEIHARRAAEMALAG